MKKEKLNEAQKINRSILPAKKEEPAAKKKSGRLERRNVYTVAAVIDWAWRIHSGMDGIRMNEKFLLCAMSMMSSARGVYELPVRYAGDAVGIGLRYTQILLRRLVAYDLVIAKTLDHDQRDDYEVDTARLFKLNTTIDADTWRPGNPAAPLNTFFRERLTQKLREGTLGEVDHVLLWSVHLLGVQSRRLDFVSPDSEVTDAVFKHKNAIIELVTEHTHKEVKKLHLIPRKGYRHP